MTGQTGSGPAGGGTLVARLDSAGDVLLAGPAAGPSAPARPG